MHSNLFRASGSPSGLCMAALAALVLSSLVQAVPVTRDASLKRYSDADNHWVDTWTSMPQLVEPDNMPPAQFTSGGVFKGVTLRQTLHMSIGAEKFRIQISNIFGGSDLPITAASVAFPTGGKAGVGSIDTASLVALTFSGQASFTIPKGSVTYSDDINLRVSPQSMLTVSLYSQAGQSGQSITGHPGSRTTSWMQPENQVNASSMHGSSTAHWYFISGVEAWAPKNSSAFIILGDSITDGRGSTDNANNRWPDLLLARMQKSPELTTIGVANQAAGGNRVLGDGLGPSLISRYKRDAITQQGVQWVMVFEGVNDIGTAGSDTSSQTQIGNQLISAFTTIARDCKAAGLKVFAATITPLGTSYYSAARETTRQKVNEWILTNGTFDAVMDFDELLRNPGDATKLASKYNSGDGLHPNVAGYQFLANSFPLDVFV